MIKKKLDDIAPEVKQETLRSIEDRKINKPILSKILLLCIVCKRERETDIVTFEQTEL